MDLSIELVSTQERPLWLVHACGLTIGFPDQASATTFARKLDERVNAPHSLSQETQKHWAAEHFRMLRGS
ncbi:hypothetical protein D9M70_613280 [compost metagenome]